MHLSSAVGTTHITAGCKYSEKPGAEQIYLGIDEKEDGDNCCLRLDVGVL